MSIGVKGQPGTQVTNDDLLALQDGLHAIVQTPDGALLLARGVAALQAFGPLFQPDIIEAFQRFIAKGRRNDSRSYAVDIATGKAPTKILERDETRIRAYLYNRGPNIIHIGGRQVTTAPNVNDPNGGIPLPVNPASPFIFEGNVGELWAVAETAISDLRVLDVSGGL